MHGSYNLMRDDKALLERHEKSPASFSVHLHANAWTLNNGPQFHYNQQVSYILDDIRAFRIPTDFLSLFDDAGVPFYEGCLIVELFDYRPVKARDPPIENPIPQRVVLRPTPESTWSDICMMNAKAGSRWTDVDALEVEARILMATAAPLCLEPDPHLTRVVNSILRVSTPNVPISLKRKAALADIEEDETEKARRAKMMSFMNPQASTSRKPYHPNFKILMLLEQNRAAQSQQRAQASRPPSVAGTASAVPPVPIATNQQLSNQNGVAQNHDVKNATHMPPAHPVAAPSQALHTNGMPQSAPVTVPPVQIPQQIQSAIDTSQRASPVKQQPAKAVSPHRPPSQPVNASQANVPQAPHHPPASEVQVQPPAQPRPQTPGFQPSIPPANFLHQPPQNRRKSTTTKPSTPAIQSQSLPSPQAPNQAQRGQLGQIHNQPQAQPQAQAQPLPQPHPQAQAHPAPHNQPTIQVQQPVQQPHPPQQLPTNVPMTMPQNMQQYLQAQGRPIPMATQAAVAAAAQRQQKAQSGRSTPANNVHNSPVPSATVMTRSPMLTAGKISGRSTPMVSNSQVARGSPLVANQPLTSRTPLPQNAVQQQTQLQPQLHPQQQQAQPMQISQQSMQQHPQGAQFNPALMYAPQYRMLAHAGQVPMMRGQPQALGQQGQMPQQQLQQVVHPQFQQPTQEQQAAAAQAYPGMQMPQMFVPANMSAAQVQQINMYRMMMAGRGAPQPVPQQMQNGQHQMPGMPTLQQMPGMGRAMPGSLQNR